jgi:hypothetical protein
MTLQHSWKIEYQVVNPSKQDQTAMIQFLGVEGCQTAEIHKWMNVIYGAACVLKTVAVDWNHMFQMGRQQIMDMQRSGLSTGQTECHVMGGA